MQCIWFLLSNDYQEHLHIYRVRPEQWLDSRNPLELSETKIEENLLNTLEILVHCKSIALFCDCAE